MGVLRDVPFSPFARDKQYRGALKVWLKRSGQGGVDEKATKVLGEGVLTPKAKGGLHTSLTALPSPLLDCNNSPLSRSQQKQRSRCGSRAITMRAATAGE